MNKKLITTVLVLAAVCSEARAQPKEGGRCPAPIYARDFSKMEVVDTTRLRVRYAFCAEKINDHLTYIDLQRLDVGKRVTKYYSQFVYQSDSLRSKYAKEHPNAQAAPNWMGVQCRMHDQWSEYEWSDYFIENGQTTIGNIKLHDKTKEYGMILQSEKILYALQHDAPEAFYVVPEGGLTAGTYHVTLGDNYDTAYGGGATYQFTLTQAVPAGGQISLDWPYNKTPLQGSGVKTWETAAATTPIETVAPTAGSGGTDLGTLLIAAQESAGLNSIHRMRYGSNRWSTSAMRQHLNSGKAAGSVWAPQNPWDRAPSWVSSTAGFMHGLDPEFVKTCADVDLLTVLSTVAGDCTAAEGSAGTGFETTKDKFFLPSRPEVFGGGDNASDKGDAWEYYKANSDVPGGASNSGNDSNRIKVNASNGNAAYWWMRSPGVGGGGSVRSITTSGDVSSYFAYTSVGVAPACVVA